MKRLPFRRSEDDPGFDREELVLIVDDVDLGPLHLEAAWCVTTEQEYRTTVLADREARQVLGPVIADGVLQTLSTTSGGRALDRGFVVLLMGRTSLGGVVEVGVEVGAALTAAGGFE